MKLTLFILCVYVAKLPCEPVHVFKVKSECEAIAAHRQLTAPKNTLNECVKVGGVQRKFSWK